MSVFPNLHANRVNTGRKSRHYESIKCLEGSVVQKPAKTRAVGRFLKSQKTLDRMHLTVKLVINLESELLQGLYVT